ncbi:hypothetical protein [Prevotella sp. 10(H)]|uniref:hypothetical protein n=1 Tax=Prevotella sp. 10(H) TaxID=1158294 RepID=UPI000A6A0553|nr:hypothetical protein [Prevotella sp. 10(H)]
MIHKIIILLSLAVWLLSCQQDDADFQSGTGQAKEERIPVKIGVSLNDIDLNTGYEPMGSLKSDPNEVKLRITNQYRIVIMKKINDKIIIDSIATGLAMRTAGWGLASFKAGQNFDDLYLELTPGKYYISIFTGQGAMAWNGHIRRGGVVADAVNDGSHTFASTYRTGTKDYSNNGLKYLSEEIHTGTTTFTVRKTEDLHSQPDPALDNIHIKLKRRVTKFRILLEDPQGISRTEAFAYNDASPVIKAVMPAVEGKYVDGLDIWGEPWYNPDIENKKMTYCTEAMSPMYSHPNGNRYYLSVPIGPRVHSPYFFSKPGDEVKVIITDALVNFKSNERYYVYKGDPIEVTLKHNNVDGIVFNPGYYTTPEPTWPPISDMELKMNGGVHDNTLGIYNSYAEHNK